MLHSVRDSLAGVGRRSRVAAIVACLLLAGVSMLEVAHRPAPATARAPVRTAPVVVAARDLPAGRLLTARDLAISRWPADIGVPGAADRVAARVGERLAGPARSGEAITATRVVGSQLTDGLTAGLAAVPISLSDPHASELIHPGERVELLATPHDGLDLGSDESGAVGGTRGSVTVVARRLLVLAVLPGSDDESTSLVVAADPATTIGIARAQGAGVFLAVPVAP